MTLLTRFIHVKTIFLPIWEKYAIIWKSPSDITANYSNTSLLAGNRVCFNIRGNNYRLIVKMLYNSQVVYIKFVGTHAEYDQVDANTVSLY